MKFALLAFCLACLTGVSAAQESALQAAVRLTGEGDYEAALEAAHHPVDDDGAGGCIAGLEGQ